jgi:hypothetical protein
LSHAGRDYFHADIPLVKFFRAQYPDASGTFDIMSLERKIDLLNSPAFCKLSELGLGPLVPSTVKSNIILGYTDRTAET